MSGEQRYDKLVTELPGGGPLAYWRKMNNGTIKDVVGTRDLTVSGAAAKVGGLPANSDEAIDLAGVASAARVSDAGLQLSAFSLSLWFMPNTLDSGETPQVLPLFTKNAADNVAGDLQVLYSENRFARIRFQDGTDSHTIDSPVGSVQANTPHHLCVRGDATGFDAYLNGRYLGKNTGWTAALSANTQDLLLGANTANPELLPDAVVDEIALFARWITEAEVITLAQINAAPEARPDEVSVPEDDETPIDVVANDQYVGAKADLVVKLLDRPGGGDRVKVDEDTKDVVYKAGPVSAKTTRSFTYQIEDANGVSNPATVSVTVQKATAPSTGELPFFGQYYGGGWPSAQNGEYRLKSPPHTFFFYAERTGEVDGFQWSWRTKNVEGQRPSYSAGDGGRYTFQIVEADASSKQEARNAAVICSVDDVKPDNPKGSMSRFVEYDFKKKGRLEAGKPYCLKVTNTHANPGGNYASQNVTRYYVWHSETGETFIEPGAGPGKGKILAADDGIRGHAVGRDIARIRGYAPHSIKMNGKDFLLYPVPIGCEGADLKHRRCGGIHCSLRYSDGTYTNWGRGSGTIKEDTLVIKGKTQLRQRFRVTRAPRTVSGVFILGWVNGTAGDLNVILEQGPKTNDHCPGNGERVDQVSVPAKMFLDAGPALKDNQFQTGSPTGALSLVHYVWVPFAHCPHTLEHHEKYNLRLEPSGCDFRIVGGARGDTEYGKDARKITWEDWEEKRKISWTAFEDSRGPQLSTDGGSTWQYLPGNTQQVPITFKCV